MGNMANKPVFLNKKPEADLRAQYEKHVEIGFVVAIAILIVAFYAVPKFGEGMSMSKVADITVEVENIPQTKINTAPPPPARPTIPVASEDDDVPEDETLDESIFEFDNQADMAPPPPPDQEEEETVPFFKVSKKPKVIKQVAPRYPELARKAGIEGQVVCEIVVGKDGRVKKARVVKSVPMLDEAALNAVKQWVFSPGEQRDRKVIVKMIVPVQFKLKN
jgi:protein TonB